MLSEMEGDDDDGGAKGILDRYAAELAGARISHEMIDRLYGVALAVYSEAFEYGVEASASRNDESTRNRMIADARASAQYIRSRTTVRDVNLGVLLDGFGEWTRG